MTLGFFGLVTSTAVTFFGCDSWASHSTRRRSRVTWMAMPSPQLPKPSSGWCASRRMAPGMGPMLHRPANDRQHQPRRGAGAVVNLLARGHGRRLRRDRAPGGRVAIESRIVAARDLETDAMAALEDHAGRPEVDP